MNVTRIGLDIAKSVFWVHGVDIHGKALLSKKLSRNELLLWFANTPKCIVGIEACSGSHYWARALLALGHTPKLIAAQHVRPYRRGVNKNDANDAKAICEAVGVADMPFVSVNTQGAQDQQMLVRVRARLIEQRTGLQSQIRGLVSEYGIVFPLGMRHLRLGLANLLASDNHGLSALCINCLTDCVKQLTELDTRVAQYDLWVATAVRADPLCKRIQAIPGVGVLTALTACASAGDVHAFKNGRAFAANLGLTPKEHSSGGRQKLLGISKKGNAYLRMLLIHGARAVLRHAADKEDRLRTWAKAIQAAKGTNAAAVALANKVARIIWALLAHGRTFDLAWISKPSIQAPATRMHRADGAALNALA